MIIVPQFLRGRSLFISFVLVPMGWLMWMPWLTRIKQPGGVPDSDVYGGLLTLVLYLLLWSLGVSNLIYDGDHGYPSWKYSLASAVFAFALVVPTIMGLTAVLHLMGRIM